MKSHMLTTLLLGALFPLGCDSSECSRLSDCAPEGVCSDGRCVSDPPRPSTEDAGVTGVATDLGVGDGGTMDAALTDAETADLGVLPGVELESGIEVEWFEGGLGTFPPPPGQARLTIANRSAARFRVDTQTWSSRATTCVLERTRVVMGEVVPIELDSMELVVPNSPLAPFPLALDAVFSTRAVPAVFDGYDSLGLALAGSKLVVDREEGREAAVLPTVPALENVQTSPAALLTSTSSLAITWVPNDEGDTVELRLADEGLDHTLTCRALPFDGALDVPQEAMAAWFALNPVSSEAQLVVFYQAESEIEELDGPRYPLVFRVGRTVPLPVP